MRYGIAVLTVATALLVKLSLAPLIERESPFTFFLAAAMVAAWYGGLGPGLLATGLAVPIIDYFFLDPILVLDFGIASGHPVSLILFAVEGSVISALLGSLYAARDAARARAQELQASEERYRRILETAYEGIWSRDAEGKANYVNPRMAQMLGYTVDEMLGRSLEDFVDAQDRDAVQHKWQRRRHGIPDQYEFRLRRRDGSHLWAIVSTKPIYDEQGVFRGALGMLTDVTPRKQAEEELRRAKEELEVKVAERTVDLKNANAQLQVELGERHKAEEELRSAKETAEKANRAKNDFLANVSHEIRNPMNVFLVTTDLLRDTNVTAKQAEYLQMMKTSAHSLLSVINDLLDFSKIEAGKFTLDHIPFNLSDCFARALKAQALKAHQKALALACSVDSTVPEMLVGDPNRLGQIITNLVNNAIKFTDEGEVVVRVETVFQSEEEVELHVAVCDTGIGIPADKFQAIFRPFEQADTSTTRRFGGTGLGLSIAAKLIALMGGRIWVDSEVGKGSTFHFTAHFGLSQSLAAGLIQIRLANLRSLPVLVVDHPGTNRQILVEILRNLHMRPLAAHDTHAALTALAQALATGEPFRVVLLDAHMAEMDGFRLAAQIRQHPDLAGTTIVLLSSTDGPSEVARGRELGIAAWLTKPVFATEMRDCLLAVLGRPPGEQMRGAPDPCPLPTRRQRILVTEDNPINQVLMMDLLEKLGHTVVTARSGSQALAALEQHPFDVVLMDVQMPEMSGLEVTARIREREKATGKHVPVIAVTAYAMKGDRERCLQAGMDDYLAKPFQTQELIDAFARLVPTSDTGATCGLPKPGN